MTPEQIEFVQIFVLSLATVIGARWIFQIWRKP